ncbi:MAG: DNA cytosine methyltransferase [Eisenbergiella sp.]
MKLTLGSLFDGIGVFPLAASRFGIRPVWVSEIEKAPVSITKRHFPEMVHLGDITKLDGGKIPPVQVITFGSPCQNLSTMGAREGLSGSQSGLSP